MYANRRRNTGGHGLALVRQRSERSERPFAISLKPELDGGSSAGPGERAQETARAGGRVQSGAAAALDARCGHAEGTARSSGGASFCAFARSAGLPNPSTALWWGFGQTDTHVIAASKLDASERAVSTKGRFSRGRDGGCPSPPAQIRTCGITAYGSYLGCLTSKRTFGCGCRILALGIHRPTNDRNRAQIIRSRWLRRRSARYQCQIT